MVGLHVPARAPVEELSETADVMACESSSVVMDEEDPHPLATKGSHSNPGTFEVDLLDGWAMP